MSANAVGDPPAAALERLLRAAADPEHRARLYALLGPFCHESRNHLNTLRLSLYLAGRSGALPADALWREQEARYREIEQAFERLHEICRPLQLTPVRLPIALLWDEAVPDWAEQCERRGIAFQTRPPAEPVVGDFDPHHLRRGLDAFVDWRTTAGSAGRTATFSWRADDKRFRVEWRESGPAASSEQHADDLLGVFALPFLTRVLAAHRGTIEIESPGAFRAVLRWPLEIHDHE